MFGAPGSGKGTQADLLCARLGVPSVSTGNILRAAIAAGTEVGAEAEQYVTSGRLVPDEIMLRLITERLAKPDCEKGFILDGYPRTLPQAQALEAAGVEIDAVVSIDTQDADIERRLSGRRVCGGCGKSYHVTYNPPAKEGICDDCGSPVTRRPDDDPQVVASRLRLYHSTTEPLRARYEEMGLLRSVDAGGGIAEIAERVLAALGVR
jgi:adenylate kinase